MPDCRPLFQMPGLLLACSLAAWAPSAAASDPSAGKPAVSSGTLPQPDLAALIQCQSDTDGLAALHGPVESPLQAVALGWTPLPRTNPFMAEYRLPRSITVFGLDADHFLISGGTVMAILDTDRASPAALAARLDLEIVLDEDGKFMAGREVLSRDLVHAESGQTVIESAVLGVSTVASHPGKLLAGCTYSLDLPEDTQDPPDVLQPATPPAVGDSPPTRS